MEATQNPYQTPEGQLTVDGQGYGEIDFLTRLPDRSVTLSRPWLL